VPGATTVRVDVESGTLMLDALIVRPAVSRLVLSGEGSTELVHSTIDRPQPVRIGESGASVSVRVYDASGSLVRERGMRGGATIVLPPGGFAMAQSCCAAPG
jgi:hypothetical protein